MAIAVEGKAEEPFGDDTVSEWRGTQSPGREERLAYLLDVLGLADDERLAPIRYQLLHRTASAIIEARRFGATHAVMLVHSFSPTDTWFEDFAAFAALYGANAKKGSTVQASTLGDVTLHLGWASDTPRPLAARHRSDHVSIARSRSPASCTRTSVRKETEIPYISHLMGVASLVLEDGGDEDEAIAALLHDAVEDQGGQQTLGRSASCSASASRRSSWPALTPTSRPSRPGVSARRPTSRISETPGCPLAPLRVSLADKLHNARAILFDLRAGHDVFARFNARRDDQLWYYDALAGRSPTSATARW